MVKLSALVGLALLLGVPVARADHGPSADACAHDPRCYARELAHTLTSTQQAIVMHRVVDFAPGRVRVYSSSREKLRAIVERWRQHTDWSSITVHGYGALDLGQRRAEKIRGYLIRYGVPRELVVAVGHAAAGGAAATTDLSIELCPRDGSCARMASR
jgi:outer membrane protein OmpA-like peptidoglycan-associated protein